MGGLISLSSRMITQIGHWPYLRTRTWPGGTLCALGSGSDTNAVAALKSVDSCCTCNSRAHGKCSRR